VRTYSRASAAALIVLVVVFSACGGKNEPETITAPSTPTPTETNSRATPTATLEMDTVTEPQTGCEEAVAAFAEQAGDGSAGVGPELLDALGLAAPQECRDLAELRAALAAHELVGLDEFVIRSCVGGDAWALLGEPSVTSDTALCREARSSFTLAANRRLVSAHAVYEEDFSGGCGGWASRGNTQVRFSCAKGEYSIVVVEPGDPVDAALDDKGRHKTMSVEADAVLVRPKGGGLEFHGVTCWASEQLAYAFVLNPAGEYGILKEDRTAARPVVLKQGYAAQALPGVGARNRIRGECTATPTGTRLALLVNGDEAAVARDGRGAESFGDFGLTVATSEAGTEVRFDNVLVRIPKTR
jgi:hypothetical protein